MTTLSHEHDPLKIATALSDKLLATMGDELADKIRHYRDASWAGQKPNIEAILENIQPDEREELVVGITRLGQLYDMASLVARDNVLRDGDGISLDHFTSVDEALENLNKPVFEVTMTAHPTNVNDIKSIKAMREMGKALHENPDSPELDALIAQWAKQPLIPTKLDEDGQTVPGVLSIANETEMTLHYLNNMYDDLPLTYQPFDETLVEKAVQDSAEYDPADLKLKMRYSSWGSSGDKDGNNSVTSETTLEAIAMHKLEIVSRYREDLLALANTGLEIQTQNGDNWSNILSDAEQDIKQTLKDIQHELHDTKDGQDKFMSPERFDELTERLSGVTQKLNKKEFLESVNDAYQTAEIDSAPILLDLSRRIESFGFNFGRIEYRETAGEYSRVVAEVIDGYAGMNFAEREAKLTEILRDKTTDENGKTKAQQLLDLKRDTFETEGAFQGYVQKDEDGKPVKPIEAISYQTMRRLKLAREFPEMITTNVLAECETTSNLLEAVFLQAASHSTPKDDSGSQEAIMGVIPLFESPEVMQNVGDIMADAYKNPAYQHHMGKVSEKLKNLGYYDEVAQHQQVQIAHSDNTRRSGIPAARALIHQAHRTLKEVSADADVAIEFFEGGSASDPLRGGIRSISAAANQYGLHDFMKFTFQGGDLLNYFNYPGSTARLYTNNFSHAAEILKDGTSFAPHAKNQREYNTLAEYALVNTLYDYQKVFEGGLMDPFLTATQEDFQQVGSRAKGRGALGDVQATNVRTITFSESFQHAGIVPTFLGAGKLDAHMRAVMQSQHVVKDSDLVINGSGDIADKAYRALHEKSGVFRDVVDRMAFGIAMTDLDRAKEIPGLENDEFTQNYLEEQYRAAAHIVLAAMPEVKKEGLLNPWKARLGIDTSKDSIAKIRNAVRDRLPHIQDTLEHKSAYMDGMQDIKDYIKESEPLDEKGKPSSLRTHLMALAHAAIDNVTHGRWVMADDPNHARAVGRMSPSQQVETAVDVSPRR